jgi:twitching motility protein PilI
VAVAETDSSAFDLLQDIERRFRKKLTQTRRSEEEGNNWQGIGFRLGEYQFVARVDDVNEILPLPATTRVPGTKPWMLGVSNIRSDLSPVIDMQGFLLGHNTQPRGRNRVLVIRKDDYITSILVDEVTGFMRVNQPNVDEADAVDYGAINKYLAGLYRSGQQQWYIFDINRLIRDPEFIQASIL